MILAKLSHSNIETTALAPVQPMKHIKQHLCHPKTRQMVSHYPDFCMENAVVLSS